MADAVAQRETALRFPYGSLAAGTPREIEPGFWLVPVPVSFPPGFVTCSAIAETDGPFEGGWTIVDTGYWTADSRAAWAAALSGPLAGRPVKRVIATHQHPDHLGLAGWFQAEHGAELWTSRLAWAFARMLQLDDWDTPPAEAERFHLEAGYDAEMMARWRARAPVNFAKTVHPMPLGVRTVAEGAVLRIGGRDWRVRMSHGHAPDHLVLSRIEPDGGPGLTIAADAVLPKVATSIGVYATEPEADPVADWMAACARLADDLSDQELVIPGHDAPFTGASTRLRALVGRHERALARLEAHLASPRTLVACWPALYRREITPTLEGLATHEARAHLNRLAAAGRAVRSRRDDGVLIWRAAEG